MNFGLIAKLVNFSFNFLKTKHQLEIFKHPIPSHCLLSLYNKRGKNAHISFEFFQVFISPFSNTKFLKLFCKS